MAKRKSPQGAGGQSAPAEQAGPSPIIDDSFDSFCGARIESDKASCEALYRLAGKAARGAKLTNESIAESLEKAGVPLVEQRDVWRSAVEGACVFVNVGKILAGAAAIIERADTSTGEWRVMARELIFLETKHIPQLHRDVPRLRGEAANIRTEITGALEALLAAARSMPGTVGTRAGALAKDFNARWATRNTARELVLKLFDVIDLPRPDGKSPLRSDETSAAKSALVSAEKELSRCEGELVEATAALVKFAESGGVE